MSEQHAVVTPMEKALLGKKDSENKDLVQDEGRKEDGLNEKSNFRDIENQIIEKDITNSKNDFTTSEDDISWKKVRWKLDLHILPFLWLLYMFSFLDRSNIGNAREAGLEKDLLLTSSQFTWILTIFHIAYILNQWSPFLWKIFKPNRLVAFASFSWGAIAMLQAAATNFQGLIACRVFLGILEPIFGAGVPLYLNFFYTRFDFGFRVGLFLSASAFSMCFAGMLAYGIVHIKSSVADWKLLFIIEGAPTVIMAIIVLFFLPNCIDDCRFLSDEEKKIAKRHVLGETTQLQNAEKGINLPDVIATFKDPKSWIQAFTFFGCNASLASISNLLPTILVSMGYEKVHAQGFVAPPYALAGLLTLATTYASDRLRLRGPFVIFCSIIGAIGYTILSTEHTTKYRYMAVFFCTCGIFPTLSNVMPWMQSNQASESRRAAGMAILQMIGQVGPILGMQVFPRTDEPYFPKGMKTCACCMFMVTVLSSGLFLYMRSDNKRRDRIYGDVDRSKQNFSACTTEELKKHYRWAL